MAALTVTAANVIAAAGATIDTSRNFGATITAGQSVYLDTVTNTYKLFNAITSAVTGKLAGVALNGGSSGQPAAILTDGNYNPGATVAVGVVYVGGGTNGAINPSADLVSTWFSNVLGIATTTSNILVKLLNSCVALP